LNNPNDHIADELLTRYLGGTATAAEQEQVRQWLEAAPDRTTELAAYRTLWERSRALGQPRLPVDTDRAWARLQRQMQRADSPEAPAPAADELQGTLLRPLLIRRQLSPAFWAAAVVALVALVFGWLLLTHESTPPLVSVSTQNNTVEKTLPDGSRVFLNHHSTLTFPAGLAGDSRSVTLTGEAFFDVAPDAAHPFIIQAKGTQVRVVGTSFNVKAYDEKVQVDVKTGTVEVSKAARRAVLTRGEGVKVEADTLLRPLKADPNVLAYRTRVFEFTAAGLDEVVQSLREGYHADVRLANGQLANCRLTARFEHETLEATLAVIAETLNLRLRQQEGTYWLDGTGCATSPL
jgi:transmembrane sensor